MKPARLAVLGVSLVAGAGAALLASGTRPPEVATIAPPAPAHTDGVLVAAKELSFGDVIDEGGARWDEWPKDKIPAGLVRKSESPAGAEEVNGAVARSNFAAGEPLRRDRLIKGSHSGFLASVLPAGKRAVAINIDAQGSSTAGGFILPNDRVDVIHTYKDYFAQTILTNIRVLAIGQNFREKNGERVITGATATLELTPAEAETVTLAQRVGLLSLTLRSMTDADAVAEPHHSRSRSLVVVRNGIATQDRTR